MHNISQMVHHSIKTQFCLSDSSSTEAIERRIYPKCKVLCHNEIICRRHLCSNLHVLTLSKYRVILTRPSYFTGLLKYVFPANLYFSVEWSNWSSMLLKFESNQNLMVKIAFEELMNHYRISHKMG